MSVNVRYVRTVLVISGLAIVSLIMMWLMCPPVWDGWHSLILLLAYGALLLSAWMFPVRVGDQSVTITLGIELPLFLEFGPVITALALCAIWALSQWLSGRTIKWTRFAANASMFTVMTAISFLAYRATGGGAPPIEWSASLAALITPALAYVCLHFISNYAISLIYEVSKNGYKIDSWSMGVLWDLAALAGEVLIAFLLILLQHVYGPVAFLVTAIPFAVLIYMFKLYANLLIANRQLSIISEITMKLNAELGDQDIARILLAGTPRLVILTACYVFVPDQDLMLSALAVRGSSPEMEARMSELRIQAGEGVTGKAFATGAVQVSRRHVAASSGDRSPIAVTLSATGGGSILAVPLTYSEETLGVLTLTHAERNAFSKRDIEMVQILANQAAIGFYNARRYAQTKELSYLDELTGLFNYRYFESALEKQCARAQQKGIGVTLLVLDIDHFKRINDSYGHLAGNEVLRTFAQLMREQVRDEDIVCRYGGEEFAVILPGAGVDVGMQIAERVRECVEATPIHLSPVGAATILPVRLTVSVGAASFPEMADSPLSLLRNADRAMYVGSKQRGRNRVALYRQIEG
ncbi:MAG: sensor domain-containing diguanylate cyclase [Firmicutes bacterium]|nr:sensor domain-containing diguanylate cyclase [Bacillota bacterium]